MLDRCDRQRKDPEALGISKDHSRHRDAHTADRALERKFIGGIPKPGRMLALTVGDGISVRKIDPMTGKNARGVRLAPLEIGLAEGKRMEIGIGRGIIGAYHSVKAPKHAGLGLALLDHCTADKRREKQGDK